jgi:transposase
MLVQMGIDWARHDSVVVMQCGEKVVIRKIERGLAGVGRLVDEAQKLGGNDAELEAAIEGGDSGLALALKTRGVAVHVFDAKQAKHFAKAHCSSGAKDDKRDARNMLTMLRSPDQRARGCWEPKKEQAELAGVLLDDHDDVQTKIQRVVNQLRSTLVQTFPAVERALGDLESRSAWAILEAVPTWQDAAPLDAAGRKELLGKCRFRGKRREAVIQALSERWVDVPAGVAKALGGRIKRLVQELRQLVKQRDELDRALEDVAQTVPAATQLQSMSGVGVLMALALLALDGQLLAGADRDDLALLCGAVPVLQQTGKGKGQIRMRKSAPARGRRTVFLVTMQAIRRLPWAKAQYKYLRGRGKTHGTAVRVVGRSLLRLLSALVRDGKPYDESRYLDSLRSKGMAWAIMPDSEEEADEGAAA